MPSDRRDFFRKAFLGAGLVTGTNMWATPLESVTGYDQSKATSHPLPLRSSDVTRLYASKALHSDDSVPTDKFNLITRWQGKGSVTWQVNADRERDYKLALCYAAITEGSQLEIESEVGKVIGRVHKTKGFFEDRQVHERLPLYREYFLNYERVPLDGTLRVPAGVSTITLRVTEAASGEVMQLRTVELTPADASTALGEDRQRALSRRASTDWFVRAKYGVMFHWTNFTEPRYGPQKSYARAVRDFKVEAFANMVQEMGAGYLIFTVNHIHPHCPAPIASWEKFHPGWTTERDLIGEIADALNERGIRMMLYIGDHSLGKLQQVGGTVVFQKTLNLEEFVDLLCEIKTEIGTRYGKRIAGYWLDGWEGALESYAGERVDMPFERIYEACKVGNPDRIVSFSFWVYPVCTQWQEYWDGEMDIPYKPATGRIIEHAAGEGLQFHSIVTLDAFWIHDTANAEMEPPWVDSEELIRFIKSCNEKQGVVTMNIGIYQDGTIGPQAFKMMLDVRRAIRQ